MISNELFKLFSNEQVDDEIKKEWEGLVKSKDLLTISYWYFTGNGVKSNTEMAAKLLENLIEDLLNEPPDNYGNLESKIRLCYFQLGNIYFVLKKPEQAKKCFQESLRYSERGNRFYKDENKRCLNQLYTEKKATEDDISFAQLHFLAVNGNSLAQLKLAICYYNIDAYQSANRRYNASVWFRKLANKGDLEAQCYLGLCYFDYSEFPSSFNEIAFKWFKRAAENGNRDAQYYLASMLEYSDYKNRNTDDDTNNEWATFKLILQNYYNSAEQGNLMAIKHLCGKPCDHVNDTFEKVIENEIMYYDIKYSGAGPNEKQVLAKNHKRYLENKGEIDRLLSKIAKYYDKRYTYEKCSELGDVASQYELLKMYHYEKLHCHNNLDEDIKRVIKMILKNPDRDILDAWPYGCLMDPLFSELYGWFAYESQDYISALAALLNALKLKESNNSVVDIQPRTYAYLGNIYYYGKGVEQDKLTAKSYYNKVSSKTEYDIGKEAYETCKKVENNNNRNRNSGCFITTAVCYSFGKNDDCYELNLFRDYRDNWLIHQPDGMNLIKKYYDIAPVIVSAINDCSDSKSIYFKIWNDFLYPCILFIEKNRFEECKNLYILMVKKLEEKYLKLKE